MVALLDRTGLNALQVATRSRLGHRDRRNQLSGAEFRQPALLLLLGGQGQQVRRHDVVVQAETDAAVAAGGGLLGDDRVVPEVGVAATAVLFGHRHAEETLLAGLEPHTAVDNLLFLPLVVVGRDVALEEAPVGLTEQVVLWLEKSALVFDGAAHGRPPATGITAAQDIPTGRLVGSRRGRLTSARGGRAALRCRDPLGRHAQCAENSRSR